MLFKIIKNVVCDLIDVCGYWYTHSKHFQLHSTVFINVRHSCDQVMVIS